MTTNIWPNRFDDQVAVVTGAADGRLRASTLDKPGFGVELNAQVALRRPTPVSPAGPGKTCRINPSVVEKSRKNAAYDSVHFLLGHYPKQNDPGLP